MLFKYHVSLNEVGSLSLLLSSQMYVTSFNFKDEQKSLAINIAKAFFRKEQQTFKDDMKDFIHRTYSSPKGVRVQWDYYYLFELRMYIWMESIAICFMNIHIRRGGVRFHFFYTFPTRKHVNHLCYSARSSIAIQRIFISDLTSSNKIRITKHLTSPSLSSI